jgi:hypothetical protein
MATLRPKKFRRPVRLDRRERRPVPIDLELIQEGMRVSLLLARVGRRAPRWERLDR